MVGQLGSGWNQESTSTGTRFETKSALGPGQNGDKESNWETNLGQGDARDQLGTRLEETRDKRTTGVLTWDRETPGTSLGLGNAWDLPGTRTYVTCANLAQGATETNLGQGDNVDRPGTRRQQRSARDTEKFLTNSVQLASETKLGQGKY
jgi:hypothetical protein